MNGITIVTVNWLFRKDLKGTPAKIPHPERSTAGIKSETSLLCP